MSRHMTSPDTVLFYSLQISQGCLGRQRSLSPLSAPAVMSCWAPAMACPNTATKYTTVPLMLLRKSGMTANICQLLNCSNTDRLSRENIRAEQLASERAGHPTLRPIYNATASNPHVDAPPLPVVKKYCYMTLCDII